MDHIVVDVEIAKTIEQVGGWDNTKDMGIGYAVVYEYETDRYRVYAESERVRLQERLKMADLMGGYKIKLPEDFTTCSEGVTDDKLDAVSYSAALDALKEHSKKWQQSMGEQVNEDCKKVFAGKSWATIRGLPNLDGGLAPAIARAQKGMAWKECGWTW